MNSYDINLALGFVSMLAVASFIVFNLGPALVRAIVQAVAQGVAGLKSGASGRSDGGALPHAAPQHWWGPHSSQ